MEPEQYRVTSLPSPTTDQINDVINILLKAKYPIIHAGSGVIHSKASSMLEKVAERLQMMITTSWAGRSAIRESNDLMLPMFHIKVNNDVRNEADDVLVLGSRIGETDWWGKAPYWNKEQKVIQVDLDAQSLCANKPAENEIQSDVNNLLTALYESLIKRRDKPKLKYRQKLNTQFLKEKEKHRKKLDEKLKDKASPMNSAHIPARSNKVFPSDSAVVFDGGNTVKIGRASCRERE